MTAEATIWQLADELELPPIADVFGDMPPSTAAWLRVWLRTPPEPCEHAAVSPLWAIGGFRAARCWSCAEASGIHELVRHCGRCQRPMSDDDGGLCAVFAYPDLGSGTIVLVVVCGDCTTERTRP